MRLRHRLARTAVVLGNRPSPLPLGVVILCPVADACGRAVGLYRDGPEGSLAGVYVHEVKDGEPIIPDGAIPAGALVVGGEVRPGL